MSFHHLLAFSLLHSFSVLAFLVNNLLYSLQSICTIIFIHKAFEFKKEGIDWTCCLAAPHQLHILSVVRK